MTKPLSITAFLLGAIAIVSMAFGFLNSNILAFFVTVIIAIAYAIGFCELFSFNKATAQLNSALNELPATLDNLDSWLEKLPSTLKMPVKLRIEGDKVALPSPVLSSYLVGLLVMLGLLGTFIGMVDTLAGAVGALQGTSELEAIRAGLTAPIEGLGLAFGTSIAGVAGSAMLGFTSTLCRRERIFTARLLDQKVNTSLKLFSLSHNRQVMTQALTDQAQSFPVVAELLTNLTNRLDEMGDKLSKSLIANQTSFHENTTKQYESLAKSVESTIKSGLSDSAQLNADNLRPIMQGLVNDIGAENKANQAAIQSLVEQQLENLSRSQLKISAELNDVVASNINHYDEKHLQLNDSLTASSQSIASAMQLQLEALSQAHIKMSEQLSETLAQKLAHYDTQHDNLNQKVLECVQGMNNGMQKQLDTLSQAHLETNTQITETVTQTISHYDSQQALFNDKIMESFKSLSQQNIDLNQNFIQSSGEHYRTLLEQQHESDSQRQHMWQSAFESQGKNLLATTESINAQMTQQVSETSIQLQQLLSRTETLIDTRNHTESQWLEQHSKRMSSIQTSLETSLQQLRNDEEIRSDAALQRLIELENTVSKNLSSLGQALEEPMSRMIETASESPKAAAEVIEQLRGEISKNIERDNSLIEERQKTMQQLSEVSNSLHQAQESQQASMTHMLENSSHMLSELAEKVNAQFEQELSMLSASANTVVESSIELSSLSEGFAQAVGQFSEANTALVGNLNELEQKLENNQNQNNEQLNFYVAQAREVIDHSLASQQAIIQQIHQINSGVNKSDED